MRSLSRFLLAAAAAVVLLPHTAAAQPPGPLGLVVASPGSVGVLWQATDRIAVRPLLSFQRTSLKAEYNLDPEILAYYGLLGLSLPVLEPEAYWSVNLDVGVLVTLAQRDALRLYVAPQIGRNWASTPVRDASNSTIRAQGLFGGQYALSDRFSLFAETGLEVQRNTREAVLPSIGALYALDSFTKTTTTSVGTTSSVGLVFHF